MVQAAPPQSELIQNRCYKFFKGKTCNRLLLVTEKPIDSYTRRECPKCGNLVIFPIPPYS